MKNMEIYRRQELNETFGGNKKEEQVQIKMLNKEKLHNS
jgi:hypothetical protein